MTKEELLSELMKKFEEAKKEFGFKSSFEEIDNIFFIKDMILKDKFVSDNFERQLSHKITELYNGWAG